MIAVVGLSGVGKSTLIRRAAESARFTHLEASNLIKSELQLEMDSATSEELRRGDVAKNQELLISGFQKSVAADSDTGHIVMDGHVVIDTDAGVIEIPSSVFARLGVSHFCFVQAPPEEIAERRLNDKDRIRPNKSVEELSAQQDQAINLCLLIAQDLNVGISLVTADSSDHLSKLLKSIPPRLS